MMKGSVTVEEILRLSGVDATVVSGNASTRILDISHDSRRITRDSMFCCISGERLDGHRFAREAVNSGATALLVEHELADFADGIVQVRVADVRSAMGPIAAAVNGFPSRKLVKIGRAHV